MVVLVAVSSNWDTFNTYFLWRFKPEYRDILPVFDKEEELDAEVPPLMELNGIYEEKMNEILQDWEEFLLSTEHIEVPVVQTNLTKTTMVPLTNAFNDNIVDLIEATMTTPITIVESFEDNKIVADKGERFVSIKSIANDSSFENNSIMLINLLHDEK
ncbi:unnamed protein product [Vicia faba]|uniref:Uncharacterized protein n=1 Tax=Vicia faba TaxID=3906 RepID=A0AAV1ADI8_VICFA|nr:unnamed protein product [Vicia faba]